MSAKPVFISYSRKDSDFVNVFIEKLRGAGVNLWIDKNIKLGGRWDNSIETALESCDDVLIIASKNSMESNNVMDEVAYSLEENKRVIPIRIEDCEMNFRLRRIQHLDYFEDEEGAFERLLIALNTGGTAETRKSEKVLETDSTKSSNSPKKKKKSDKKLVFIAIAVLVIGYLAFQFFAPKGPAFETNTEQQQIDSNFDNAENSASFDSVNDTLQTNENVDNAIINANEQPQEEVALTDQEDWDNFPEGSDIATYRTHMANYPDCVHVETANKIIKDFEDINYQLQTWKRALEADDIDIYLNYIEDFGRDGVYYSDAVDELEVMFEGRGYVQFSESNGNRFFEIFEASAGDIPKEKDLIYALNERFIRAGKLGTQAYENILYTTQVDEAYIILEVEQTGTAFWVKVAF